MGNKILVIDDDPLVLKTLIKLLTHQGYSVESAKNCREAESHVERAPADLIICDIRMPEHDGIEVISRLKETAKRHGQDDLPFLFITGYASEDAPISAIKLGARDYILKPFDLDELLASVRQHIT
jgi:DNA-binding response OmpR family regulator